MTSAIQLPVTPASTAPRTISWWRSWIEKAIRKYDMLPGIQAICKGRYKRLATYQIKIIVQVFKQSPKPSVILGGREIAKTFTIALAYLIRCLVQPGFEVYLVPGKKIDQAKAALKYVNIIARKSAVIRPMSGLVKGNQIEWSTLSKHFTNHSLMHAMAPNEGVVSEHGCVWCDEYQYLPDAVDEALKGFTGRPGDRMVLSGTADKRGSPLHRAYKVALIHHPKNVVEVPVIEAINAGILSKANIESKRDEMDPVKFDAWFNCKFPDTGSLAWHPKESSLSITQVRQNIKEYMIIPTGCDPGIPVSRYVIVAMKYNGECHAVKEFEIDDLNIANLPNLATQPLYVEHGQAFHGGYNFSFHNILDMNHIAHQDSIVDGEARDVLFSNALGIQGQGNLYVNPLLCPNLWRACEEQTFDVEGKMDKLPLSHWIFALMHALRACRKPQPPGLWIH